jgi:hypothetical protein
MALRLARVIALLFVGCGFPASLNAPDVTGSRVARAPTAAPATAVAPAPAAVSRPGGGFFVE